MATTQSFYEVLGLETTASQDEVRAAWRRTAKALHPDAGGDAEAFKLAALAYETLREPAARSAYDRSRSLDWESGVDTASTDFAWRRWQEAAESVERRARREERRRAQESETVAWWVAQKADAEENRIRFRKTAARNSEAADTRRARVLRPLWQARSGLLWQDGAVFLTLCGAVVYAVVGVKGARMGAEASPTTVTNTKSL